MLTEENKRIIFQITCDLCKLGKKYGINIPIDYIRECTDDIIIFYDRYLKAFQYKDEVTTIDYFKVASWCCIFMGTKIYNFNKTNSCFNVNWKRFVVICILDMLETLKDMGYTLKDNSYKSKIAKMVVKEIEGESDFGIGKNGLYIIMKFASLVDLEEKSVLVTSQNINCEL